MKKPTLATHSQLCCGECAYCNQHPDDKKFVACFVSPPQFLYGTEEDPVYEQFKPISVTRSICKEFKPKGTH